jgi:hypothetical protein
MAKKKAAKKQESQIEEPKILTDEEKHKTIEKFNKLKSTETMTLPDEAVVNIPISGQFYKAIDGMFYYLLDPLSPSEILHTMAMIKKNFEGMKPEQVTNQQRAIWCIMTLLSEIHWQSDAQNKLVKTDKTLGSTIQQILHGVEGSTEQLSELVKAGQEAKKKEDSTKNSTED